MNQPHRPLAQKLAVFSLLFLLATIVLIALLPGKQEVVLAGTAKPYQVVLEEKTTHERKSRFFILAPEASSVDDRAATVKAAAEAIYAKENKAVTEVFLEFDQSSVGGGSWIAKAAHYADGCDISGSDCGKPEWEILVSDSKIDPKELEMYQLWQANKKKPEFATKDGLTFDDDKLKAFIAKKLSITPDQVKFPDVNPPKSVL